jgi:hypothetical protein
MRYDVFLVSALKDQEKAELIVRKLRALKFKVRYDKKREHTTPTPKDYRDADSAQSILVLWSKAACNTKSKDSDWVHAIAHHARSKPGVLIQAGLDKTVPDEPFADDDRYALSGLTARTTVKGLYELVDDLGKRDGRKGLREWMEIKTRDKDAKDAWKAKHPTDPLSLVGKPRPKPAPAPKAAVSASAETGTAPTAPALKPAPVVTANIPGYEEEGDDAPDIGQWMIIGVLASIGVLLFFSWLLRTQTGAPAVGNAAVMSAECPAGQMPAYLLDTGPLEPGPIIDDTVEEPS